MLVEIIINDKANGLSKGDKKDLSPPLAHQLIEKKSAILCEVEDAKPVKRKQSKEIIENKMLKTNIETK